MFSGLVLQNHSCCSFEINCIKLYCVYFGDPQHVFYKKNNSQAFVSVNYFVVFYAISFPKLGGFGNTRCPLKVVCNENQVGSGRCRKVAYVRYVSRTVAIEVRLPFYLAVLFDFIHFHFRSRKAKSIGNILTNRQSAALSSMVFSLHNAQCLLTHRINLRY